MARIDAGGQFGRDVAPATNLASVPTPRAAFGSSQALDQAGQRIMNEGLRLEQQQKLEADRADAARATTAFNEMRSALRDSLADLDEGIQSGRVAKAEAPAEWLARSQDVVQNFLPEVPENRREILRLEIDGLARQMRGDVVTALKKRDRTDMLTAIDSTAAYSQRLALSEPEKAADYYAATLQQLGPHAGLQPDQIRKLQRQWVAGTADLFLADGKADAASALLDRFAEDIEPSALLRVRRSIELQQEAVRGTQAVAQAMQKVQSAFAPDDFSRVVAITLRSESRGRRFDGSGGLLTSPAGAKGEMQVMDGTNRDPGFGVAPARDNSPEERARVGRDYLAAMVQRYRGDLAAAWAAYNAGPGAVDREMQDAAKRGEPNAWLSNMPAETQAYVRQNVQAFNSGAGAPSKPSLGEVHDAVRAQMVGASPQVLRASLAEATRLYRDAEDAAKSREDDVWAAVQGALVAGQGRWSAVPRQLLSQLPPGRVDDALAFANRIAKGQEARTDWNEYLRLRQLAAEEPAQFAKVDLRQYLSVLAGPQLEQLADLQAKAASPAKQREVTSLSQQMNATLAAAKITNKAQRGEFLGYVQSEVDAATQSKGKPLTYVERQEIIDRAMLRGPDPDAWLWGTKRMFELTPEQRTRFKPNEPTDAPATEIRALNEALQARGIPQTPSNRLALYNRARSTAQ